MLSVIFGSGCKQIENLVLGDTNQSRLDDSLHRIEYRIKYHAPATSYSYNECKTWVPFKKDTNLVLISWDASKHYSIKTYSASDRIDSICGEYRVVSSADILSPASGMVFNKVSELGEDVKADLHDIKIALEGALIILLMLGLIVFISTGIIIQSIKKDK